MEENGKQASGMETTLTKELPQGTCNSSAASLSPSHAVVVSLHTQSLLIYYLLHVQSWLVMLVSQVRM